MSAYMKPTLLDLFCGAGGAAMGYHRAGFDVVGVDIQPQPHYPFEFHQADALEYCAAHGPQYDVIHASPPCQAYSVLAGFNKDLKWKYPRLIEPLRDILINTGRLYVIENVPLAPLRNPIILCGNTFGLHLYRHRAFESNVLLLAPPHLKHTQRIKPRNNGHKLGYYNSDPSHFTTVAGHMFSLQCGSEIMGIDWMTRKELAQAIPPAYTEFIGAQMLIHVEQAHAL